MRSSVIQFKLLLFLLFLAENAVNAQIWLEHQAIYDEAEWYLEGHEFEEAIPLYQLLEKKGVSNAHISYKLGLCYLGLEGKKHKSISYFEEAVAKSFSGYKNTFAEIRAPLDAYLKLGIAYRINNEFDAAVRAFETYKDSVNGNAQTGLADYYLKQVENARFFHGKEVIYELKPVEDNTSYSVFNPVAFGDSLVYYTEERPFYDAIVSGAIKNNILIERENLTPSIGTEHEVVLVSVSPNDMTLVLRGYEPDKGYELYYSSLIDGTYAPYQPFPEPINSPSQERFASFSSDGNKLFFTSNRPGGIGGGDIYVSNLQSDSSWSEPQNIGNTLNTNFDEEVCYISHDGKTLYFSSEGHINMGGHDLFYSKLNENNNWASPVNFGLPLSTTDDDLFISPGKDNELYTSRYSVDNYGKKVVFKVPLVSKELLHKILVHSQLSFTEEIPAKQVSYLLSDANTGEPLIRSVTDSLGAASNHLELGEYLFRYIYSDSIFAEQIVELNKNINLDEISLSAPEWQMLKTAVNEDSEIVIILDDILFDFNSSALSNKYFPMLDTVVKLFGNNVLKSAVIEGYTDGLGSSNYNLKLAARRAQSVANYLESKGISKTQYTIKSIGESQPVAIERNQDGTDNPTGRKYNRRVALRIVSEGQTIVIRKTEEIPEELKAD